MACISARMRRERRATAAGWARHPCPAVPAALCRACRWPPLAHAVVQDFRIYTPSFSKPRPLPIARPVNERRTVPSSDRSTLPQQPAAHRLGDRRRTLGDAELLVEVAQVGLDRRRRDLQLAGDLGALAPPAVRSRISCSRGDSAGRSSRSRIRTWSASPAWISAARIVWPRATAATVSQITARSASFVRYARTPGRPRGRRRRRRATPTASRRASAATRARSRRARRCRASSACSRRGSRRPGSARGSRRAPRAVLRRPDDLELRALAECADQAVEVDRVVLSDVDGDPRGHDVGRRLRHRATLASSDRMIRRA